ncbi:hypothetical protein A9Q81_07835 [Gammaproteobacteria bacterium 42_54_T18]|nr:hypothetical protein A9Q81_07835 [Gammaproteobacteria bacterium 42_54_T18]
MANKNNEACSNTKVDLVEKVASDQIQEKTSSRKLIEKSLLEIKRLRKKVKSLQENQHQTSHGEIAIVGVGCRLPGKINNLNDLWEVLEKGQDCISYDGNDRWPWQEIFDENQDAPGKLYTKAMGLLEDPIAFDADFFGVSPREANEIDPQQRLLLEVSYHAMENAGYSLQALKGSKTGVFVGVSSQDYSQLGSRFGAPEDITPWQGTGVSPSAAAGRLSYLYDFNGPSLAVDTACSSSLVALHYACQSLRQGECDAALVGGVNMILNPGTSILFSKAKMLSVDGHCKTFDKDANGYVRSEGCAIVMVKRLKDAIKDGDHIHGVIRGTAVNQDGRSQGLTAPNEVSQQKVINAALQQAQCDPDEVTYVEAHGTGTPLGDPIEINALQEVYGKHKAPEQPLHIGSCKTNFGHAEAAAGMFGLLKLIVSLQHKKIPASLHFSNPNPYVNWGEMNVKVVDQLQDWPETPLRAGLSGFGFTGTNAHVIVESYDAEPSNVNSPDKGGEDNDEKSIWHPAIFPLSAKNKYALKEAESSLSNYLSRTCLSTVSSNKNNQLLSAVSHTLAVGREHYHYRSIFSESNKTVVYGKKVKPNVESIFRFTNTAVIDEGVVNTLKNRIPYFGKHWNEIKSIVRRQNIKLSDEFSSELRHFGYQYSLSKMFIAWGIAPKTLIAGDAIKNIENEDCSFYGDNAGLIFASELSAACVAGLMSLENAINSLFDLVKITKETKLDAAYLGDVTQGIVARCQRPRLRFISPLAADNGELLVFSSDTKVMSHWASHLVSIANKDQSNHIDAIELEKVVSWDISISLNECVTVIVNANMQGGEKLKNATIEQENYHDPRFGCLQNMESLLMAVYVVGIDVDWKSVFINSISTDSMSADSMVRKVLLPGYPFQRKDYWNTAIPLHLLNVTQGGKGDSVQKNALNGAGSTNSEVSDKQLGQWSYQYSLEETELLMSEMSLPQQWLVISDDEQNANALYSQLISRGHQATAAVMLGNNSDLSLRDIWNDTQITTIKNPDDFRSWLLNKAQGEQLNIVFSVGNESGIENWTRFKQQYTDTTKFTLYLSQTLASMSNICLWTITANGLIDGLNHKDEEKALPFSCTSSLLTGFSKVLALELSDVMQGHLDYRFVDSGLDRVTASALVDALMSELPCANLHFDGKAWSSPVLQKVSAELIRDKATELDKKRLREDAFYLIAGGTGSIGLAVAQRLIDHGAKHIVLLSRSGVDEKSTVYNTIMKMKLTCEVLTPAIDICNRGALTGCLEALRQDLPIAGVVHAAGTFDISPLKSLTSQGCFSVMDSKVIGLRWLDELTREDEVEMFIGFSSIASVWGSAGNFHYSAANYAVDSIIYSRQSCGLPGVVINWGPWAESNMVTNESEKEANKRGLFAMDKTAALQWFDQFLLRPTVQQTIVVKAQWQRLKPLLELTKMGAVLRKIGLDDTSDDFGDENEISNNNVELSASDITFKQALETLSQESAEIALLEYVKQQLATALESEIEDIDVFQPLLNLGIDSLMAVEFKNRVTKVTGVEIPLVKLLEGSNLCDLSKMLCDEYFQLKNATSNDSGLMQEDEEFLEGVL